ncbi:MAG: hypothetical protein ABII21_02105 [bacterium]
MDTITTSDTSAESQKELDIVINKLDPKTFFFDVPPYEIIPYKASDETKVMNIMGFDDEFDAYFYILKENTTFEGHDNSLYNRLLNQLNGLHNVKLECKRTGAVLNFYLYHNAKDKYLMKVGQYPSLADLHKGQIAKYDDVLSPEKMTEFVRAIGLKAHGVGIGSFVYLRRIFEDLIDEAHSQAKKRHDWLEQKYIDTDMKGKIKLLKDFLPEFLVKHAGLYSILSLGLHVLSEQECLAYFEAVKMGIEEILEEKLIALRTKQRKEKTEKEILIIQSEISKK